MTWDSVPYFVGGGAQHSPEVARLLAYAALGGAEGIVGPADLKVAPYEVPGTGVRVLKGAALILNRATGGDQQTYAVRNPSVDVVEIAPTGSSGGRSDLIVAQIEDPNMPGEPWQRPEKPESGPYVFTRVIPNVPKGTTRLQDVPGYGGRTAVTLARVDLPASTGTVTSSMVTDLRAMARPRSERVIVPATIQKADLLNLLPSWQNFPETQITGIPVPAWATHAAIRMETTIRQKGGNAYAQFEAYFTTGDRNSTTLFATQTIDFPMDNSSRQPIVVPSNGWWEIPTFLRGVTAKISSRVRRGAADADGRIGTSASDYYFADVTFTERPV